MKRTEHVPSTGRPSSRGWHPVIAPQNCPQSPPGPPPIRGYRSSPGPSAAARLHPAACQPVSVFCFTPTHRHTPPFSFAPCVLPPFRFPSWWVTTPASLPNIHTQTGWISEGGGLHCGLLPQSSLYCSSPWSIGVALLPPNETLWAVEYLDMSIKVNVFVLLLFKLPFQTEDFYLMSIL